MDSGKMANVNVAAVMHNGQWLKISDRDEVQNLINQRNHLQDENSSMLPNVWLECKTDNTSTGKVLCNPYTNHVTGLISLASGGNSFVHIQSPSGYKFIGDGTTYVSFSTKYQGWKMSVNDGVITIWWGLDGMNQYAGSNQYDPIGIDSYVDVRRV